MTTRTAIDPETLAAVQTFAERIRRDFPVKQILLYGSRARGDHQPDSDVDVAVVLEGERRRPTTVAMEFSGPSWDVMLDSGLFISALPVWLDDWEQPKSAPNPWLIDAIKREGIPF